MLYNLYHGWNLRTLQFESTRYYDIGRPALSSHKVIGTWRKAIAMMLTGPSLETVFTF